MYGSQKKDPSYISSILITVSVENGPNTVTKLNYCLPVKGIKPDNTKKLLYDLVTMLVSPKLGNNII